MKTRNTNMKANRYLSRTAALLGAGALALVPFAASAQMRGGGGMSGGGMSRGGGGGVGGGGSFGGSGGGMSRGGGSSAPSYSAPQSPSRPSYSPSSVPSFSRPSYSPSSMPSPSYSRPGYSPSGMSGSPVVRGGGSDPLFGRTAPTGYNYGEAGGAGYRYQAQNRGQFPNTGGGQAGGQVQNGRQGAAQTGRTAPSNVVGPGNYPNLRQSPIVQAPLPQARQITQPSSRTVNSLVYSHNPAFYGNLHGLNAGNAYGNGYNPSNPYRIRYGQPHGNGYFYGNFGFNYFAGGLAYYPYYSPYYSFGYNALSPYAFYYGAFPSFITLGSVYTAPPEYVYVPYPVYQNGTYSGERTDDVDGYYLNRNSQNNANRTGDQYRVGENGRSLPAPVPVRDAALDSALNDIRDSWKTGKIDSLAKHVRRDAKVAVYLRGKYQYSLDAGDYLDMTKDALSATQTVRFDLDAPKRKENGVYTITGRHIYRDKDGNERTVHVTYVLEKSDSDYVLTQVGSAPDKVEDEPTTGTNTDPNANPNIDPNNN